MAETVRRLYDVDWVNGNCSAPFSKEQIAATTTDNLFFTYMSNYLIGLVGTLGAVAVLRAKSVDPKYKRRFALFLGITGLGYWIAGVGHQFFYHPTGPEEPKHELAEKASYTFVVLGNVPLSLIMVQVLVSVCQCLKPHETLLDRSVFLLNGAVLGTMLSSSPPKDAPVGFVCFLMNLILALLWFLKRRFGYAVSMLLSVLGFVIQAKLAPLCGDASYAKPEDATTGCWRACPLPVVGYAHPFNHNALYHTVYAASIALLAALVCLRPEFGVSTSGATDKLVEGSDEESYSDDGEA